jgi:NADH:ubiquinone oxidoreductase subunit B-like Fe-S oxidoreductase
MDEQWVNLAEQYRARTQTDPANVQAWTACAAVAMKRAVGTKKDADRYAQQMATMLKQMDARSSPCTDVIPASMF